jgi:hypothetical protein
MTGTRDPQQDGSIQAMLRDSGLEASTELRSSLDELRALVPGRAPAPRADLAALLATGSYGSPEHGSPEAATTAMPAVVSPPVPADAALPPGVTSLTDRRRSRKRRLAIVGGAVVGAMSLGAGAVAASSEDFRHNVGQTIGVLFQPAGHAPAPEHAQPSPADIPAVPAAPTPAAPAGASTAPASPTAGATGSPAAPTHATPPAVGRDGELPAPGQRPVTPGVHELPGQIGQHGLPGPGDGPGEDRSLPEGPAPVSPTLPVAVPTKLPGQP